VASAVAEQTSKLQEHYRTTSACIVLHITPATTFANARRGDEDVLMTLSA
jgi:hypothetical protein